MDPKVIGLIGLCAGVFGTGLGSLLVTTVIGRPSRTMLSVFLGLAAGIMLAVIFSDLIPEAVEIGGFLPSLLGLVIGAGVIMIFDLVLPHTHLAFTSERNEMDENKRKEIEQKNRFIKVGVILGLGIAMHNLPEGLAIGAGYIAATDVGLGLAVAISVQNIPEGMAMAAPLLIGGIKWFKVLFYALLAGVPMGVGAFVGALLGGISPLVLSLSLGFAAGAMLYIIFDEMIPGAQEIAVGHSSTFGGVAGVIIGIVMLSLI